MSSQRYTVDTEVDASGTVAAFLFGGVVGLALVYPALPSNMQAIEPALFSPSLGPVAAPLLGGIALFMLFFVGVFVLNWLFIRASD